MNLLLRHGAAIAIIAACTVPEAVAWSKMFNSSKVEKSEEKAKEPAEKKEAQPEQKVAEAPKAAEAKADTSPVVAVVNGTSVTLDQVKDDIRSLPPQIQGAPFDKIFPILRDRRIDMMLITEGAQKAKISDNPEVQRQIKMCQEATVQKAFLDQEIKKIATDSVLKKEYDAFLKSLPKGQKEVRLRHILVKTEGEAKDIISQLNKVGGKPEEFATLAREKSLDASKDNGGELGYIRLDSMPKEFAQIISKAAKATLIQKPIKTELGYHVVRVEDIRDAVPPSYNEIKDELMGAIAPKMAVQVIESLRKGAKIERRDQDGKPIDEKKEQEKVAAQEENKPAAETNAQNQPAVENNAQAEAPASK